MTLLDDYKLARALFGGQSYQPTGTGYTLADTYTLGGVAQSDSSDGTVSILLDNYDPDDPQPVDCSTAVSVVTGDKVLISVTGYSFSVTSVIGGGDRMQGEINAVVQTADGKNSITYSLNDPSGVGAVGDVWYKYTTGNVIVGQWVYEAGWISQTLDNAIIASISAGKITAGTISAAIEMLSAIMTGGLVRTSSTGNRVEIYDDDSAGYIKFLDASGIPRAILSTRLADNIFAISSGANNSAAANVLLSSTHNEATQLLEGAISLDAGVNTGDPGRDSGNLAINKHSVAITSSKDGSTPSSSCITLSHVESGGGNGTIAFNTGWGNETMSGFSLLTFDISVSLSTAWSPGSGISGMKGTVDYNLNIPVSRICNFVGAKCLNWEGIITAFQMWNNAGTWCITVGAAQFSSTAISRTVRVAVAVY